MYNEDFESGYSHERSGDEIYSKPVRAGKRTYFFDVKSTKGNNDFYLTITESKRRIEQDGRYSYDKHKIFLYREDLNKFLSAFSEAANYAQSNAPQQSYANDWSGPLQEDNSDVEEKDTEGNYKIDIEF